jgi:hypothetical protein
MADSYIKSMQNVFHYVTDFRSLQWYRRLVPLEIYPIYIALQVCLYMYISGRAEVYTEPFTLSHVVQTLLT